MWKRLTTDDLKMSLSQDEIDKLDTLSLTQDKVNVIVQEQLDSSADAFRGAFRAKGYYVDSTAHSIPSSYVKFVLDYARWGIWVRFPMTESYSLSEPRKIEYEFARDLLKNPYIGVDEPDPDPEDPDIPSYMNDKAISIPFQKFPSFPWSNGFWGVYMRPCKIEKKGDSNLSNLVGELG